MLLLTWFFPQSQIPQSPVPASCSRQLHNNQSYSIGRFWSLRQLVDYGDIDESWDHRWQSTIVPFNMHVAAALSNHIKLISAPVQCSLMYIMSGMLRPFKHIQRSNLDNYLITESGPIICYHGVTKPQDIVNSSNLLCVSFHWGVI